MDFPSPEPVIRALRERVEHGIFGCGSNLERSPRHEVFAARLERRYGWRVALEYARKPFPEIAVAPPEGTSLAWLDCRGAAIPGGDPFTFFLESARVALSDGGTFGRGGEGFVRLNFASPRAMLAEGLERMRRALDAARR